MSEEVYVVVWREKKRNKKPGKWHCQWGTETSEAKVRASVSRDRQEPCFRGCEVQSARLTILPKKPEAPK